MGIDTQPNARRPHYTVLDGASLRAALRAKSKGPELPLRKIITRRLFRAKYPAAKIPDRRIGKAASPFPRYQPQAAVHLGPPRAPQYASTGWAAPQPTWPDDGMVETSITRHRWASGGGLTDRLYIEFDLDRSAPGEVSRTYTMTERYVQAIEGSLVYAYWEELGGRMQSLGLSAQSLQLRPFEILHERVFRCGLFAKVFYHVQWEGFPPPDAEKNWLEAAVLRRTDAWVIRRWVAATGEITRAGRTSSG